MSRCIACWFEVCRCNKRLGEIHDEGRVGFVDYFDSFSRHFGDPSHFGEPQSRTVQATDREVAGYPS